MKIKEIKRKEDNFSIYVVTFKPNWLEKLFGVEEKQKEYKDSGRTYTIGGGAVYINKDGDRLGNGNSISDAIDKWRRSW
jgi:hypothetical protein